MDIDVEERRVPWTAAAAERLDRLAQAVPVIAREPMTGQLLARMSGYTGAEPLSVEQVAALRRRSAAEVDVRHLTGMTWVYLLDADHLWDEGRAGDLDGELAAMAELHRRSMVLQPCTRWGRPPSPTTLLHMVNNAREIDGFRTNRTRITRPVRVLGAGGRTRPAGCGGCARRLRTRCDGFSAPGSGHLVSVRPVPQSWD